MTALPTLGADATQILAAYVNELTLLGVKVPSRQLVAIGQIPVWDGAQLTVNLLGIDQGQPGRPFGGTYQPPSASVVAARFSVSLIREIPVVKGGPRAARVPDAATMTTFGAQIIQDAAALVQASIAIHQAASITSQGQGFEVGPCVPVVPDGGLAGSVITINVSLS